MGPTDQDAYIARLKSEYAAMPDGRLLDLSERISMLTAEARSALEAELKARGLSAQEPLAEAEAPTRHVGKPALKRMALVFAVLLVTSVTGSVVIAHIGSNPLWLILAIPLACLYALYESRPNDGRPNGKDSSGPG